MTSAQIAVLSRDLQEKETLLSTGVRSSAETEELLATVDSLTEERDQLKIDLHENIEMVSEHPTHIHTHKPVFQLLLCFPCMVPCFPSLR